MCSIMGYSGKCIDREKLIQEFNKTLSRGPDMTRVVSNNNVIMGFHRLAIMDLNESGMQPFEHEGGIVVCNGEIYGFRNIKRELINKGYTFTSESDCEVLLPLYREYGTDMFNMLDSEFALIIYDNETNSMIAARDPIGIRPLYYGYDSDGEIIFASEAKNLAGLCEKIMPFPPGHYYKQEDKKFYCYRDITAVEKYIDEDICTNIRNRLIAGVEKRLDADAPLGFLLSGGLDSSLVCAISAKLLDKPIRTFAVGMNTDAIDLKYARIAADYLGTEHTEVYITKDDVIAVLPELIYILGTYDITTIRASVGMYLICKAIHETTDVRVLLTGEISDELFGYKYTDFAPDAEAFQEESVKRIKEIHMYDVLRADRCISSNSIEARVPFGDLEFVKYVMAINPELKLNSYGIGKFLLRKAFEGDWLPDGILLREKAAFSDAVGHSMVDYIKEYCERLYSDGEYEELKLKYAHTQPFTKESLYYRELFEKFYPEQADMITGYWMPNKEWDGCNVNDPSARVLANYGTSGK